MNLGRTHLGRRIRTLAPLPVLAVLALAGPWPAAPGARAAENAAGAPSAVGLWETEDGKARIRVEEDGRGHLDGTIVWLGEPLYPADDPEGMGGQPRVDRDNPEPDLRDRPILGLRILEDLRPEDDGEWAGGRIYDPETGNTYKCKARLGEDGETLHLRGYIGISLIGRTTEWTRVAEE